MFCLLLLFYCVGLKFDSVVVSVAEIRVFVRNLLRNKEICSNVSTYWLQLHYRCCCVILSVTIGPFDKKKREDVVL